MMSWITETRPDESMKIEFKKVFQPQNSAVKRGEEKHLTFLVNFVLVDKLPSDAIKVLLM